ncbi:MAG: hypothetical protein V4617_15090 [Gemmatimonadota bacterium]
MELQWAEPFTTYGGIGATVGAGLWRGSLPGLVSGGRFGGPRVRWDRHSMSRGGGGPAFTVSLAIKLEGSPVQAFRLTDTRLGLANTLTSKNWIVGCAWNGFAYCGLVVSNDGAVHFVRGGAFENGPNSQDVEVYASSGGGVFPFTGWCLVQFHVVLGVAGTTTCRINGDVVLSSNAYNKNPGDYCSYVLRQAACPLVSDNLWPDLATDIVIGGPTRGSIYGGGLGWTGYIDSVWAFDTTDLGDPYSPDLRVDDLVPNGDGALSQSAIGGTSPAATRWQSLTDVAVPDDAATTVVFDDTMPKTDEYTLANLPHADPTIYGVHAVAIARRGPFGTAQVRFGLNDGANTVNGGLARVRTPQFQSVGTGFPLAPDGGAWTLADVQALRLRIGRET